MIDRVQQFVGNRLKTVLADAAYCSILDLKDCADRGIELLAPVQANGLTEEKKQSKEPKQIPREEFTYDPQKDLYTCPAGQELPYAGRDRRQRHGDRTIVEFRYACDPIHCGSCNSLRSVLTATRHDE